MCTYHVYKRQQFRQQQLECEHLLYIWANSCVDKLLTDASVGGMDGRQAKLCSDLYNRYIQQLAVK